MPDIPTHLFTSPNELGPGGYVGDPGMVVAGTAGRVKEKLAPRGGELII